MIDERQQELARRYACNLLADDECARFEAEIARHPELRQLVARLRETAGKPAFAAPPPKAIDRVVGFPRRSLLPGAWPWTLAAGFALCSLWLGGQYFLSRSAGARLDEQRELAEIALRAAHTRMEMERVTSARLTSELTTLEQSAERRLADAEKARTEIGQQLAELRHEQSQISERLAAARHAAAATHAELVALNRRLEREGDLARLKIATFVSMLNHTSQALAVAVWDPARQEGIFTVDQLATNANDDRYELWVIDDAPVSAGVFTVSADGRARVHFKPVRRVQAAGKFAVSREKNDGLPSHASPAEIVMMSR